jgi:spore cortex formation protein SpoVR/YcgB (stage V sporulation)
LFDELHNLKDENDELIDMFVNEKCFKNIKNKVCRKYKGKNPILDKVEVCELCKTPKE